MQDNIFTNPDGIINHLNAITVPVLAEERRRHAMGRLVDRERSKDEASVAVEGVGGLRRTATALKQLPHMVEVGLDLGRKLERERIIDLLNAEIKTASGDAQFFIAELILQIDGGN